MIQRFQKHQRVWRKHGLWVSDVICILSSMQYQTIDIKVTIFVECLLMCIDIKKGTKKGVGI